MARIPAISDTGHRVLRASRLDPVGRDVEPRLRAPQSRLATCSAIRWPADDDCRSLRISKLGARTQRRQLLRARQRTRDRRRPVRSPRRLQGRLAAGAGWLNDHAVW